jgi:AcrR family transcriptional regulator
MTTVLPDAGRADARRNRAKVLAAAVSAFAGHGLEVSLSEIARQAGVGTGTVYRHFPSKQILLEAVLVRHVDDLAAAARRWAARTAPTAALFGFLIEVIDKSNGRKHFCDVVTADVSWPRPMLALSVQRFHRVLAELLYAAQRAGGIRPDVSPDDVAALTVGCATAQAAHRDPVDGARMARLALECLRSPAAVTEGAAFRDTSGGRPVAQSRCAECGTRFTGQTTGRPARYCGATCRQRAHRRRSG